MVTGEWGRERDDEDGGWRNDKSGWSSGLECAEEKKKERKSRSKQLFFACCSVPHFAHIDG